MKNTYLKSIGVSLLAASISIACGRAVVDSEEQKLTTPSPSIEAAVLEEAEYEADNVRRSVKQEALASSAMPASKVARLMSKKVLAPAAQGYAGAYADSMVYPFPEPGYIQPHQEDRENYAKIEDNPVKRVAEQAVSTFSIDVDTGAYANVRRFLNQGALPDKNAVRAEELINYFNYQYPSPDSLEQPFSVNTELSVTPWNKHTRLLHIGIKGYEKTPEQLPASNLVFLVDVSGSMNSPDKLGLLKSALKMLSKQMRSEDTVAIAVYAGAAGTVLEPTPGNQTGKITAALDQLSAGGSTNGGAGIRLAYNLAERSFIKGGVNRVILATDGDFNVGTTNFESLIQLIEEKRKTGIALTTLGFGTGNYNDHLMEQVADAGNGNYAYIDTLNEARKVLVEEMGATLLTIAKDVKIQIEFNPSVVSEYRLIGYENRMLKREDFNNDKVDAGEIGAGHTVTALYEITLNDSPAKRIEPLRYGNNSGANNNDSNEFAFMRLRYKKPMQEKSRLIEQPLYLSQMKNSIKETSDNYRFSAAVAAFSQLLRGGIYTEEFNYGDVLKLARDARSKDKFGYRGEFIQLVGLADSLDTKKVN